MTAQYPALPGLSSLSRWLTWITVHTPRSGLVIKTVTEGIRAISLSLALSSFHSFSSHLLLIHTCHFFFLLLLPLSPSASFQLSPAAALPGHVDSTSSPVSSTFSQLCFFVPPAPSSSILPSVSPHLPPSLHPCALNLVLRDCLCLPAGLAPV